MMLGAVRSMMWAACQETGSTAMSMNLTLYEKRVDALLMLLAGPKNSAFRVDALRRTIEDYAEQEYDNTAYYDRWMRAIRNLLLEQELLTQQEIDEKVAEVCDRLEQAGQKVTREAVP